ncbi:biotin synthase-like protein [Ophiocordyceps sinensis CO18]|uniref:Biotin synthase-like protein n=1 Tax=Ophiocordyceps sinensis (strain Co18 / CGMCC 3.14243) TaxID=911162 RepID=T5A8X2_OPHSC|nr:biotin synthase-like protein [Ophiocordyceps sinensis CO18]
MASDDKCWKWQRLIPLRLRYLVVPALVWCLVASLLLCLQHPHLVVVVDAQRLRFFGAAFQHVPPLHRMPSATTLAPLSPRVACYGPRRRLLSDSPDDDVHHSDLPSVEYPVPFLGSHRELGIPLTWTTADGRYGPYGFGQESEGYRREKVDWEKVDWGFLQDSCMWRNTPRFPRVAPSAQLNRAPRFTWRNETSLSSTTMAWHDFNATRRTALVVRAYAGYHYKPEDLWNIRSLAVEAALQTGGEYAVMLLVHVQDREPNIFHSRANYKAAFEAAGIPPELQSIALLWDDHLLESWYAAVGEHRTMWAVNQPLQLFALHYPEFDHYWQIELDQRFTGDAGKYLDALSAFARNEPRKQALERATYAFNQDIYGTYRNFTDRVNLANNGTSRAWGPIRIPDIHPIGPEPPVARPQDDDFAWGVGEDADVVVTSFCADAMQTEWVFRDYIQGFRHGTKTPRWFCPPAIMRASRALLLAVHQAQHDTGLSLPSEAVLPTWALWHGLKLSYPPQPAYMRPREGHPEDAKDDWTRDAAHRLKTTVTPWFGNATEDSPDGLSHGNPQSYADHGLSWWWTADYPREIVDAWLAGSADHDKIPGMLAVRKGGVYAPNMAMHPVKT